MSYCLSGGSSKSSSLFSAYLMIFISSARYPFILNLLPVYGKYAFDRPRRGPRFNLTGMLSIKMAICRCMMIDTHPDIMAVCCVALADPISGLHIYLTNTLLGAENGRSPYTVVHMFLSCLSGLGCSQLITNPTQSAMPYHSITISRHKCRHEEDPPFLKSCMISPEETLVQNSDPAH